MHGTTIDTTVLFLYLKTMSTSYIIRQCKKGRKL